MNPSVIVQAATVGGLQHRAQKPLAHTMIQLTDGTSIRLTDWIDDKTYSTADRVSWEFIRRSLHRAVQRHQGHQVEQAGGSGHRRIPVRGG